MNDDIADIENALRCLTPRAPSEFCTARIAAVLDAPARPLTFRRVFAWATAVSAAAAGVAAVVLALSGSTGQIPAVSASQAETTFAVTAPRISVPPEAAGASTAAAATGPARASASAAASDTAAVAAAVPDATANAKTLSAIADGTELIADNGAAPEIVPTEHRVLRSVEPLEIRRGPDGNFFQPYRLRYLNTVRATAPRRAGTKPDTFVESFPAEEVHFVRLDFM
jgi:hypothetical protein